MYTFGEINDATGFANGDRFTSEQQAREYFTEENIREMFSGSYGSKPSVPSQETLNAMAEAVIENRWHFHSVAAR